MATLGADGRVWHHTPHKSAAQGPTMLTGRADLTRDQHENVRAQLLDLVPGRSGSVFADCLRARTSAFRDCVPVATLDPFCGYANALRDELAEATPVLDAFHVAKLAGQAMDEVCRRVQQDTLGRRGHKNDPLYRFRNILRAGADHLRDRQWDRLSECLNRGDPNDEVFLAWQCCQQVRAAYAHRDLSAGKSIAEHILRSFASCLIPETARLGRTLRQWKQTLLSHFTTDCSSNGRTAAINGAIEPHRRIARGYRNRATTDSRRAWPAAAPTSRPHRKSDQPPRPRASTAPVPERHAAGVVSAWVTPSHSAQSSGQLRAPLVT